MGYMYFIYMRAEVSTRTKYDTWLLKGITFACLLAEIGCFLHVLGVRIDKDLDETLTQDHSLVTVVPLVFLACLDVT